MDDLTEVVLGERQEEVGGQPLLGLDLLAEGQDRPEGAFGLVQIVQTELAEPPAGDGLDPVVRVEVLPIQQPDEDLDRGGPVLELGEAGPELEQGVLGVGMVAVLFGQLPERIDGELPGLLLGLGQPPVVEGRARIVRAGELAEQPVVETNGIVLATGREGRPTLLEQLLGVEALDGQAVGPLAGLD